MEKDKNILLIFTNICFILIFSIILLYVSITVINQGFQLSKIDYLNTTCSTGYTTKTNVAEKNTEDFIKVTNEYQKKITELNNEIINLNYVIYKLECEIKIINSSLNPLNSQ